MNLALDEPRIVKIRPQDGPQEAFLTTPADIALLGGAAGGGKTYGLLMEPMRNFGAPGFGAVIFRRTRPMIMAEGAMWHQSYDLYGHLEGSTPSEQPLEWTFDCTAFGGPPGEARVKFSHMEHEKNRFDWQGAQVPMIGFDQLETFTEKQFMFMLARSRTVVKDQWGRPVRPKIRATANPQPGWLADFIQWWWNPDTGYPIEERGGVIRYFVRVNDTIHWDDDPNALMERFPELPEEYKPKSFTFIPADIYDNPILMESNPEYLSNLYSLSTVERERLLKGNWKIRYTAGGMFPAGCFPVVGQVPAQAHRVRYWDEASTPGGGDYTAGVLMAWWNGVYYVEDVVHGQWATDPRDRKIIETAGYDSQLRGADGSLNSTTQYHQTEGGSSGKDRAREFVRMLAAYPARIDVPTGSKTVRADPYSSQAQVGNVKLRHAPWNKIFTDEHEMFPTEGFPDDLVDAASGAYNKLAAFVARLRRPQAEFARR